MDMHGLPRNAIMALAAVAFIVFGLQFVFSLDPEKAEDPGSIAEDDHEEHDCEEGGVGSDLVKGSMSFAQISEANGICLRHFSEDFGLPDDFDYTTPLRDIKTRYGLEVHTSEVKAYVAAFVHEEGEGGQDSFGPSCPFGYVLDPYPGKCGLYVDMDSDRICDLSQ